MKTTKLGKTSLDIPAIALGVMRMGTRTPEEGAAAINAAYMVHAMNLLKSIFWMLLMVF